MATGHAKKSQLYPLIFPKPAHCIDMLYNVYARARLSYVISSNPAARARNRDIYRFRNSDISFDIKMLYLHKTDRKG